MRFYPVILFLLSSLALSAQSSKVQNMKDKQASLSTDIVQTNKLLSENENSSKQTQKQIRLLSQKIDYRKQMVEAMNQEIAALNEGIDNKEKQILLLEKKIDEKKANYIASAKKIYLSGNDVDKFLFIFSAKSLTQSYQRILYLKRYSRWQKKQAKEIVEQQIRIASEKQFLENGKKEKENLVRAKIQEEKQLQTEEQSAKKMLETLTADKQKLTAEVLKKKAETEALGREIDRIIKEEQMAAQKAAASKAQSPAKSTSNANSRTEVVERKPASSTAEFATTKEERNLSSNFASNRGKLPFPLKGNYRIVKYFGTYTDPSAPKVILNCSGLQIETTPGNDARTVFNGTVMQVFASVGYDKTVLIRHGEYITVYSNLESVYVKRGDKVTTGQSLGKIAGKKDNSAVLYFEVRRGDAKQDPFPWLRRN